MTKGRRPSRMDYSTIDLNKLQTFEPVNDLVNDGRFVGVSCFCSPPGHPSYFVENAVVRDKVVSDTNAKYVLKHPDDSTYRIIVKNDDPRKLYGILTDDLYLPLPYESDRVQAWIERVYEYDRYTYLSSDKSGTVQIDKSGSLDPERHMAYIKIKSMYPEHEPSLHLIRYPMQNKTKEIPRYWWEKHATPNDFFEGG